MRTGLAPVADPRMRVQNPLASLLASLELNSNIIKLAGCSLLQRSAGRRFQGRTTSKHYLIRTVNCRMVINNAPRVAFILFYFFRAKGTGAAMLPMLGQHYYM